MNEVLNAAREVQAFCEGKGWKFCIIGGIALIRWGEPRETVDVDVTLLTGFGSEEQFIDAILNQYKSRVEHGVEFALTNRVLLIRAGNRRRHRHCVRSVALRRNGNRTINAV